jgi:protein phosphatase
VSNAADFDRVWRGYSWETPSIDDIRIAPFHVLASEDAVHVRTPHTTHMEWISRMVGNDPIIAQTEWHVVDLSEQAETDAVTRRWIEATSGGAEGIVVKPLDFTVPKGREIVQPALKVRGKDYLRIIYGVDYDLPENLERLRVRAVKSKRARAIREYALGVEALERLVRREPLRRVHECVAAIIAMEADPADPRL